MSDIIRIKDVIDERNVMRGEKDYTDTLLQGGNTLCYIKTRFLTKRNRETMDWLFACLRDSVLIVPSLPISGRPDLLEDETGSKYLPVFSQEEQMPRDYITEFDLRYMDFDECLSLAKSIPQVVGITLDAFSSPLDISFEMAEVIIRTPSRRHPDEKEDGK